METKGKYTVGPWHIKPDRKAFTIHIQSELEHILTIQGMNETNQANARLIAAAPELLEACKLFMELDPPIPFAGNDGRIPEWFDMFKKMQAAIAKAEGREYAD